MFQNILIILTVILTAELIVNVYLLIKNAKKLMGMIKDFYVELNSLSMVILTESETQKDLIKKIGEDVLYIKGHSEEVNEAVDKAAKQYQEEISSLFSYCGRKE